MLVPLLAGVLALQLDAILDNPKLSGSIVSCAVADDQGKVVFERNSGLRVMPGSNQKLLTGSYALFKLGPGFRPAIRIWKQRDRVVVASEGDPMLTHDQLRKAAADLGLNGKLPVHVHEAYRPLNGPSWEWDDLPNKYAAPVCAFTVDRGSIELWAEGGRIWIEPSPYWLRPTRGTKTGPRKVRYDPARRTLIVDGELPAVKTRIDTLALDQPDEAAASYLGRRFELTETVPSGPPDLTVEGSTIKETLEECLPKSDNNLAENLLLMSANREKPLGSDPYVEAAAALKRFLVDRVGEAAEDFRPDDGSGMSRHDLVTTRGIVKLLLWDISEPTKDVWLGALAKPGSGTLANRLGGVDFVGKTGSLDVVAALSGYVRTRSGKVLAMSLILNGFICSENDARQIQDDFVRKLAEDRPTAHFMRRP